MGSPVSHMSEKRLLAFLAAILGLVAGVLILAAAAGQGALNVIGIVLGFGILYGSYLIYRGRASWFSWGRTRTGALINLVLGLVTLFVPGGVGGVLSVLAIVSGFLGLLAA